MTQLIFFLWANQTDGKKEQLEVEFFLFNKNYTPYTTNFLTNLNTQIKPLFLYDILNEVNMGAGTGLAVREFELSEAEDNVLLRTKLENVGRAETLLHLIEHQRSDIVSAFGVADGVRRPAQQSAAISGQTAHARADQRMTRQRTTVARCTDAPGHGRRTGGIDY